MSFSSLVFRAGCGIRFLIFAFLSTVLQISLNVHLSSFDEADLAHNIKKLMKISLLNTEYLVCHQERRATKKRKKKTHTHTQCGRASRRPATRPAPSVSCRHWQMHEDMISLHLLRQYMCFPTKSVRRNKTLILCKCDSLIFKKKKKKNSGEVVSFYFNKRITPPALFFILVLPRDEFWYCHSYNRIYVVLFRQNTFETNACCACQ